MTIRPANPFDRAAPTEPTKAQREAMKRKPAELDALLAESAAILERDRRKTREQPAASARASWDKIASELNGRPKERRETIPAKPS